MGYSHGLLEAHLGQVGHQFLLNPEKKTPKDQESAILSAKHLQIVLIFLNSAWRCFSFNFSWHGRRGCKSRTHIPSPAGTEKVDETHQENIPAYVKDLKDLQEDDKILTSTPGRPGKPASPAAPGFPGAPFGPYKR